MGDSSPLDVASFAIMTGWGACKHEKITFAPTAYPTPKPTRAPKCSGAKLLAGPFTYFNEGHAKNCEHRHHYLYEYKGADCIWTSKKFQIATPASYGQLYTTFSMMEYGNLEDDDHLKIEIRKCHADGDVVKGSCGEWSETMKLQDDVLGWRWTAVYGAHYDAYLRHCENRCYWYYRWGWRRSCS